MAYTADDPKERLHLQIVQLRQRDRLALQQLALRACYGDTLRLCRADGGPSDRLINGDDSGQEVSRSPNSVRPTRTKREAGMEVTRRQSS